MATIASITYYTIVLILSTIYLHHNANKQAWAPYYTALLAYTISAARLTTLILPLITKT